MTVEYRDTILKATGVSLTLGKNVILRDIEEDKVPTRPIAAESMPGTLAALGRLGPGPRDRLVLSLLAPGGNRQRYLDFARFITDGIDNVP